MHKNTFKKIVVCLVLILSLVMSQESVRASFFDDFVDFIDPTQHIDEIEDVIDNPGDHIDDVVDALDPTQHIEDIEDAIDDLPGLPGLPDGIGTPTLPDLDDLLEPPLVPVLETRDAKNITSTSATIEGYVNPHGAPSTVGFMEWGTTPSLGNKGDELAAPVPSTIEQELSGLTPDTTYYYRVSAENLLFEEEGDIKSFRTLAAGGGGTGTGFCDAPHTMTLNEVKEAIVAGGSGNGVILREIDPATGNGVIINDTDCSFPVSMASYTLDNPNDPGYVNQTFFAASPANTISQPHSTLNLHVDLPQCNFQADYFYGDNYPRPTGNRNNPSQYFLDSGYIVNREAAGGFSCSTPAVWNLICVPSSTNPLTLTESITFTAQVTGGGGPFTYSWTGTDGLTGTTSAVTRSYSTIGNKSATVTAVASNGETKTATCNTTVVGGISPFDISCPAVESPILINREITRRVEISGGTAPFQISWTGTDGLSGSSTTVSRSYDTTGSKEASVTVVDATGQTLTRTCNTVVVNPEESGGGGGGGSRRSSRSSNRPDVNLVESVEPAPLANSIVYLSDVPYTGVTDYPGVMLFLGGTAFWSVAIGGFLMVRNARRNRKYAEIQNMSEEEVKGFVEDAGNLKAMIEDEARGRRVLLSEDAVEALILQGEKNQSKTLSLLEEVVKANRLHHENDEWISVNAEKVNATFLGDYKSDPIANLVS